VPGRTADLRPKRWIGRGPGHVRDEKTPAQQIARHPVVTRQALRFASSVPSPRIFGGVGSLCPEPIR
jgi:hypothetical protein